MRLGVRVLLEVAGVGLLAVQAACVGGAPAGLGGTNKDAGTGNPIVHDGGLGGKTQPGAGGNPGGGGAGGQNVSGFVADVNPIRDLDIVFMIDDSGSMKEEQDNLNKNFPAFMQTLKNIPGGLPNLHIGVVSSDVGAGNVPISQNPACNRPGGDRGIFQAKAGCGLQLDSRFIISLNNGTQNNFTGSIENVFSCIANLGTLGCGYEHQLQSVRVALAENVTPQNAGFLRASAYLAVILITDEDDCSAPPDSDLFVDPAFNTGMTASLRCNIVGHVCNGKHPPTDVFSTPLVNCGADPDAFGRLIPVRDMTNFLFSLKPSRPERIIVSVITGWPDNPDGATYSFFRNQTNALDVTPACMSTNGSAAPALRLRDFVASFGNNGSLESICQSDFSPALKRIGDRIAANLNPGCIDGKLFDSDLDPANGFQPSCTVMDRVLNDVTGKVEDTIIGAQCDNQVNPAMSTNKPCYQLQQDPLCRFGTWRLVVFRNGEPAPGTLLDVKCRACGVLDDPMLCK